MTLLVGCGIGNWCESPGRMWYRDLVWGCWSVVVSGAGVVVSQYGTRAPFEDGSAGLGCRDVRVGVETRRRPNGQVIVRIGAETQLK